MDIGVGLSLEKNPILAVKEAIKIARQGIPKGKPDLAILFSSPDLSCSTLSKTIYEALEGPLIIGSTGIAIIANQGIFNQGLVLMLIKLSERVMANIAHVNNPTIASAPEAGKEMAEKLLLGFQDTPRTLGLLFSDNIMDESSGFIRALREKLGTGLPLIGACNSGFQQPLRNYLYYNNELSHNAYTGMLLGGRVNFGMGTKHGWEPLGKQHIITSSQGNIIRTIDNKPAIKLYEDYLGCPNQEFKHGQINIFMLYPLGISVPGEDEHILRNAIFIDEDSGALHLSGSIPEGVAVRLMIATKETCLNATRQAVEQSKIVLSSGLILRERTKKFALVFNSLARYTILKKEAIRELEIIKDGLEPNTPLIGLYTYGGLIPLKASNYLGQAYCHNQNVSILIIGG
jgi:hypothetical protein